MVTSDTRTAVVFKSNPGVGGASRYVTAIAEWTENPIYISYGKLEGINDVIRFGSKRLLPYLRRQTVGDFLDRLLYTTWKVPTEYDIIISSGFTGKLPRHRPNQHRIHLAHGYHRGAFGVPPRDNLSNNSTLALAQRLNRRLLQRWEKYALSRMDSLVVNSEFTKLKIQQRYGITADEVIHPPIEIESFYNDRRIDKKFYLFLDRIAPEKGVVDIVKSFKDLRYELVVAGSDPLLEDLKSQSEDNISFLDYISEERKRKLLAQSTGFIQNSSVEDFGITTIETLASGTPVIAADTQNNPYLIEDGENGVLFETADRVAGIKQGINRAKSIEWDPNYIQRSAEKYSTDASQEQWESILSGSA